MLTHAVSRRLLPVFVTAVGFSGGAIAHPATSVSLCVPSKANTAVTSASSTGTCASGSTAVALPSSSAAQQTLISILPHLSIQASGVGGKPTIQVSGVNLQLVNGSGSETTLNGEGNLVIGYDPKPQAQTGSHNLVFGTFGQSYTSYGGLVAGFNNQISGPEASIVGGFNNTASGLTADVTGGEANTASGQDAWIGGGLGNRATVADSAVSGGALNLASGSSSSILGGVNNVASGNDSSVSGGDGNTASGGNSSANSVGGGASNTANGQDSWVGGGSDNTVGTTDGTAGGTQPQSVPLNSNWTTTSCCGNRDPKWYIDDSGVVHLQGAVTQVSPTNTNDNLIGTLPPAASPSQTVYEIAHGLSGTYTDVAITPQGNIFAIASRQPAVTDWGYVSLEGLTYRP
jgi:hypothetical protein